MSRRGQSRAEQQSGLAGILRGCLSVRLGVKIPDVERGDVGGKRIHPLLVCDVPCWPGGLGAVLGDRAAMFALNLHVNVEVAHE